MNPSNAPYSLLISDLHLSSERPDISAAFTHFCRHHAPSAQSLYILGDLCDAWLGDDDDSTIASDLRQTLSDLTKQGVSVFIMRGNRDFLFGEGFCQTTGAQLLEDPTVVNLYGHDILLMHGDSLCVDDQEYMAFRSQIQDPAMRQLLLDKPLNERKDIAKMLRSQSRSANANKASDIMDVNTGAVEQVILAHKINTIIHGHTHRPKVHQEQLQQKPRNHGDTQTNDDTRTDNDSQTSGYTRYVLGDWDQQGWCIRVSEVKIDLIPFDFAALSI